VSTFLSLNICFLIMYSYILNRGWIDRAAKRIPTYQEITNVDTTAKPVAASKREVPDEAEQEGSLVEDGEFEDFVDRFESSYNFRFEEP
jgi:protein KRI1